jgi:hypothetical protein
LQLAEMIRTSLGKADGKNLAKAGNEPAGTPPPVQANENP